MTSLAIARRLARRDAKSRGHDLPRIHRSPFYYNSWVTVCRRCSRSLTIKPNPNGSRCEWIFIGGVVQKDCVPDKLH